MVTANILRRVLLISYGEDSGTAFTVEHNGIQYLVSARHIFDDEMSPDFPQLSSNQEITISYFHDKTWKDIRVTVHLHPNEEVDIIVFELEEELTAKLPITLSHAGLILGQDTYFLGFPYGKMYPDKFNINLGFPLPFVKKATCSTHEIENDEGKVHYLDGHTTPGFSGGPIVFFKPNSNEINLLGIMRGYVAHKGELIFEEENEDGEYEEDTLIYDENSGIIKIQSVGNLIEILNQIENENDH